MPRDVVTPTQPWGFAAADSRRNIPRRVSSFRSSFMAEESGEESTGQRRERRASRFLVYVIITVQLLWALAVPIKNVVMIGQPNFRVDSVETEVRAYTLGKAEAGTAMAIPGAQVVQILEALLDLVIGNEVVRDALEASGALDLDTVHELLAPQAFKTVGQYYALLFQMSEFPGGTFTPRPSTFTSHSELADALSVWIRPNDSDTTQDWLLKLSCPPAKAYLNGMHCYQGNSSDVCVDFPQPGEVRRYEERDFSDLRRSSGLANNIGMLYMIEVFHIVVNVLLSAKDWQKTVDLQQSRADQIHQSGFVPLFKTDVRGQVPMVPAASARMFGLRLEDLNSTNLASCLVTELVVMQFYTNAFVLSLVQTALVRHNKYNAHNTTVVPPLTMHDVLAPMLSSNMYITSGARFGTYTQVGRKLFGHYWITSITNMTTRLKLDKKFNGEQALGSPMRMLEFISYYPEYYSVYRHSFHNTTSDPFDEMEFWTIGGAMSGLNTLKNDWWANTMGVHRLSELPREPNDSAFKEDSWWDSEKAYAAWYQALENSTEAPFYLFNPYIDIDRNTVPLDDNPATCCHRAFFKALGKVAFMGLAKMSYLSNYFMFMSQPEGGPYPWFLKTWRDPTLYGENLAGKRTPFAYSITTETRKDDGSNWVILPLLNAMITHFGFNKTLMTILTSYNATFTSQVATEYGLIHFADMGHCQLGFARANISRSLTTSDQIAERLYPLVALFLHDLLEAIPALFDRMDREVTKQGVPSARIRRELILGSPSTPFGAGPIGSPILWQPTPLTAGLLKFWPAIPPPPKLIDEYRASLRCYWTLELRYLNTSTRCWVEPNSEQKSRVEYKSELLRTFIFSNWSISLVLNVVAIAIALEFLWRFVDAWRWTRFRCVNVAVALQLHFQGTGVLTFPQIVLMSISTLPLMVAYHLPADAIFMPQGREGDVSKQLKDVIVTLAASWFQRLGFEIANHCYQLHEVCYWYNAYRVRVVSVVFIYIVRSITPDKATDTQFQTWKLISTCVLAMVLGVLCAAVPLRAERTGTVVVPTEKCLFRMNSVVVQSIQKSGLPLNKYGLVGFSHRGWSLAGLIIEGWRVHYDPDAQTYCVFKDHAQVPLRTDHEGRIKCIMRAPPPPRRSHSLVVHLPVVTSEAHSAAHESENT
ncbi:TPA: hypothetical protein N0F65_012051 [Lagenidium giganteum]|uniref:Uncharacterized protein n=1 Tax=Lagenidium giganteum TaxID=4803 RepID=A0AAV2YT32_9STRA|nr:TPA: hypothetical protein N0F65_012051 [Lagenidium giganteum]